jgi:hypothetical protein
MSINRHRKPISINFKSSKIVLYLHRSQAFSKSYLILFVRYKLLTVLHYLPNSIIYQLKVRIRKNMFLQLFKRPFSIFPEIKNLLPKVIAM